MKRNKSLIKRVLLRDIYICQCCGFKADEVHHIVPLSLGGKDSEENMTSLCSFCHSCCYDIESESEFKDYINSGGDKLKLLLGVGVEVAYKNENLNIRECIKKMKSMIRGFQKYEIICNIEKYNIKKVIGVK